VVDPYGGTLVDYEECYIELARLVKKTIYKLNEEYEREI
jgi:protein-tyrosine phosphatase